MRRPPHGLPRARHHIAGERLDGYRLVELGVGTFRLVAQPVTHVLKPSHPAVAAYTLDAEKRPATAVTHPALRRPTAKWSVARRRAA